MRGVVHLVPQYNNWECPNCDQTKQTFGNPLEIPMHTCPGLRMLSAPFIEAGTRMKVTAQIRGDYLGTDEQVRDENGAPVMAIVREREEGTDVWVQAGFAKANFGGY